MSSSRGDAATPSAPTPLSLVRSTPCRPPASAPASDLTPAELDLFIHYYAIVCARCARYWECSPITAAESAVDSLLGACSRRRIPARIRMRRWSPDVGVAYERHRFDRAHQTRPETRARVLARVLHVLAVHARAASRPRS